MSTPNPMQRPPQQDEPDAGRPLPAWGTAPPPAAAAWGTPPQPPQPQPAADPTDRNWAVAAHLSGFVASFVALGFLGSLTVLLVAGNRSPFIRRHAVEALNFNITVLLYVVVGIVTSFVLIGIPILIGTALLYLVATIRGAIAASAGGEYRYPLSLRLVR